MMRNDWQDDWEVDVEARKGIYELQDYLRRHAAFDAYCAEQESDERPE